MATDSAPKRRCIAASGDVDNDVSASALCVLHQTYVGADVVGGTFIVVPVPVMRRELPETIRGIASAHFQTAATAKYDSAGYFIPDGDMLGVLYSDVPEDAREAAAEKMTKDATEQTLAFVDEACRAPGMRVRTFDYGEGIKTSRSAIMDLAPVFVGLAYKLEHDAGKHKPGFEDVVVVNNVAHNADFRVDSALVKLWVNTVEFAG